MKIIGKIAVKRNKKDRAKKIWLTIGLIAFVIVMICEIILRNYAFLALFIPFLYLLNLRNNMGENVLYKDVVINIDDDEKEYKVEISNSEYMDKVLYSVRFMISKISNISTIYTSTDGKFSVSCVAKKALFLEDTIIPVFNEQFYDIQFYVALEDAKKISAILHCPLDIKT